jgi:Family of unknown function (DUF6263)
VSRTRLGVSAVLLFALAAFVGGQEPKKDAPKEPPKVEVKDPPKVDPKDAPKDPPKVDPKAPPGPDGKTFNIAYAKDKKFYSEVTTNVTQIVKVQGQDLTQKQESTFWYDWTTIDQKDGKWTVRQKVDGLKMTIDISGNLISYDSTKPDSPAASNPGLNEFFKKLGTAEFDVTLDKNSRVEKVDGKDKFINSIAGGNSQMDALLKKVLTDDALKDMCDPSLKLVPDAPKKVGESWKREGTLNLGPIGKYKVTYDFKYRGPATEADKKDMDVIDLETTMTYEAPPKDSPDGAGLLFRINAGTLKNEGPGKGVIYYNTKAQRPESAEVNLKLKGELTVNIGGADTKVELEMTQKTLVRYGDASLKPAAAPPKP